MDSSVGIVNLIGEIDMVDAPAKSCHVHLGGPYIRLTSCCLHWFTLFILVGLQDIVKCPGKCKGVY